MRRRSTALILTILAISILADAGETVVRRKKSGGHPTAAPGAGMVVSVSGTVTVSGRWQEADAYEGLSLAPGESLTVHAHAVVSGFRPTGEPFEVEGPASLTMNDATPQFRNRIYDWTRQQIGSWKRLNAVDPFGTPQHHDWEATAVGASPMVPVDGGSVRPGNSRFWWKKISGVEKYELEITWQEGRKTKRMRKKVRDGNQLTVNDLEPGREYQWRVYTKEGKKVVSKANTFRVLTEEETGIISQITYGLPEVMAGTLVLTAGLHEEAIQYFDSALATEPNRRSALVWRSRALAATGRYEEAYRDLVDAMVNNVIEKDSFSESFYYDGVLPQRDSR